MPRRRDLQLLIGFVATALGGAGCAGTRHIDPLPPPPAVAPQVALPPDPPAGIGRLVIDTVDGPADVQIKQFSPYGVAGWRPLCTAPCVADIPLGQHELSFGLQHDRSRTDVVVVPVTPGTSVYRRILQQRKDSPTLLVGGYAVGYTGLTVLMFGLMFRAVSNDDSAGNTTMLVGAGMAAAGGLMFYYGWPSVRPGSATQFALPPR